MYATLSLSLWAPCFHCAILHDKAVYAAILHAMSLMILLSVLEHSCAMSLSFDRYLLSLWSFVVLTGSKRLLIQAFIKTLSE